MNMSVYASGCGNIKKFLQSYIESERELNNKLEEAELLRDKCYKISSALGIDRIGGNGGGVKTDGIKIIDELMLQRDNIVKYLSELVLVRKSVKTAISSLQNRVERDILEMRYILGRKPADIALETGYCERQVMRLMNSGIAELSAKMQ